MSGAQDASGPIMLPRELVRASAGSGKTFRISSRIIGLLAHGESPDAILASTFTRKAAGEILGRVLVRLARAALDPHEAAELQKHAALSAGQAGADDGGGADAGGPDGGGRAGRGLDGGGSDRTGPRLDCERCRGLLGALVRRLHRMQIGTLDAFFVRAARNFSHELGLPPGWSIADPPTHQRVRSDALQETLRRADPGALVELVRLANRGEAARSIHDGVFRDLDALHRIHHRLDPSVPDPWDVLSDRTGAPVDESAADRIANALEDVEPPKTKSGKPSKRWVGALSKAADRLRSRDWTGFVGGGLGKKVVEDDPTYYRKPIPTDILGLLGGAVDLARQVLAREIAAQARALGRLVERYDAEFEEQQRRAGAYRFGDVTRLLGGPDPLGARLDLYYRLDLRVRHLLLDEFQDTSLAQWDALRPLAEEVLTGEPGARAAVVVADPKQSIYGWRGAAPELVHHVGEWYAMRHDGLARSWRSSQAVLDVVNDVFRDIERSPVLEDADRDVAAAWARSFEPHEAARELEGHVRIAVGPADEGRSEHRPLLLAYAADLVCDLHDEMPGFSIGVLTRQNKAVARLIHELRSRGVEASEEGGNPLTDSASVTAVLALLRLADHPADRVARYHVARSPVGRAVADVTDGASVYAPPGNGAAEHRAQSAARRLAQWVRTRLLRDGYGATLDDLADRLAPSCGPRERRRLDQLAEFGFQYDARATLRPTDFVRRVEAERVEDPSSAGVRVMTVHQSKGLEFDIVLLPELDASIFKGGGGGALPYRAEPTGPITRVYPYVRKQVRRLFPEIEAAYAQRRASRLRDALSGLYVAMTRARHALHIVIKPDEGGGSSATTSARIVREALAPEREAVEGDAAFYSHGNPRWFEAEAARAAPAAPSATEAAAPRPELRAAPARRSRVLPRRSPSSMEADDSVELGDVLRLEGAIGRETGTIVHAWCEEVGWLDDGMPDDRTLREVAGRIAARPAAEIDSLIAEFREWMRQPAIVEALRRDAYPAGASLRREDRFVYRTEDTIVEGMIDRLVLWDGPDGEPAGAEVIDYKTDRVADGDALDRRAERYRPQLDAYRDAVASLYELEAGAVGAKLLFVRAGGVRTL